MGIKKNQDGTWEVYHSKRHPKLGRSFGLRRKGFKTIKEAIQAEKKIKKNVEELIRNKSILSWQALVSIYRESMIERDYALNTIESSVSSLRAHTFGPWKSKLIEDITGQEIRQLVKDLNRSAGHKKNMVKYIRGAFDCAIELGHLKYNPTPKINIKIGHKIKNVFTKSQVKFFLEQAEKMNNPWYPHWVLAVYSGLRNGELYCLTWDKVTFERRQILVNCSWHRKSGLKCTKSGDDRIVEIAPRLLTSLKKLKLQQGNSSDDYVLPRIRSWAKGEQARELRKFLIGIGLEPIRFHDLRATWATILLSQGIAPIKIMAAGGWKDLKTMQIYIRKAGVDIAGITDNLDLHDDAPKGEVLDFQSALK